MNMCAKCSTQYRPEETPDGGFCVARPMVGKTSTEEFKSGIKSVVTMLESDFRASACGGKIIGVDCPVCMDKKKVFILDPQNGGEVEMKCPRGCANK